MAGTATTVDRISGSDEDQDNDDDDGCFIVTGRYCKVCGLRSDNSIESLSEDCGFKMLSIFPVLGTSWRFFSI